MSTAARYISERERFDVIPPPPPHHLTGPDVNLRICLISILPYSSQISAALYVDTPSPEGRSKSLGEDDIDRTVLGNTGASIDA